MKLITEISPVPSYSSDQNKAMRSLLLGGRKKYGDSTFPDKLLLLVLLGTYLLQKNIKGRYINRVNKWTLI